MFYGNEICRTEQGIQDGNRNLRMSLEAFYYVGNAFEVEVSWNCTEGLRLLLCIC